nr:MAG TPA: hypothetical protein [Caudoviricetes sp.]
MRSAVHSKYDISYPGIQYFVFLVYTFRTNMLILGLKL